MLEHNSFDEFDRLVVKEIDEELKIYVPYNGRKFVCKELDVLAKNDPKCRNIRTELNRCAELIHVYDTTFAGFIRKHTLRLSLMLSVISMITVFCLVANTTGWFPLQMIREPLHPVLLTLGACYAILFFQLVYSNFIHKTPVNQLTLSKLREYISKCNEYCFLDMGFEVTTAQFSYDLIFCSLEDQRPWDNCLLIE